MRHHPRVAVDLQPFVHRQPVARRVEIREVADDFERTPLTRNRAGEELFYDYGLVIDAPYTPALKAEYPCWCGARNCRGTILAPKRKR